MRRFWNDTATASAWASLAPEFRVLCLAARHPQTPAVGAALQAEISGGIDWTVIAQGAGRHRVATMVLSGFGAHQGLPVPAEVMTELRRLAAVNARRALAQAAEVIRLSRLLADGGVRVLVLKGVAMSLYLHGEIAMRGVGDIDLLVAPGDFATADAVLLAAGYGRRSSTGDPIPHVADWGAYRDLSYHAADRRELVELHQRLTANRDRLPYDFEVLWSDREEISLAGAAVSILPSRVLPVYLCVHGANHCWERLCWLSDLSVLQRRPEVRARMLADAEAQGLGRAMRLATALADQLLGPLGQGGDRQSTATLPGPATVRYAARFFAGSRWLSRPPPGGRERLRYEVWRRWEIYTLKPGWRHVWRELCAEFLDPVDRTVIPLPNRLRWLYPGLRPVGWVIRHLRRRPGDQRRT